MQLGHCLVYAIKPSVYDKDQERRMGKTKKEFEEEDEGDAREIV